MTEQKTTDIEPELQTNFTKGNVGDLSDLLSNLSIKLCTAKIPYDNDRNNLDKGFANEREEKDEQEKHQNERLIDTHQGEEKLSKQREVKEAEERNVDSGTDSCHNEDVDQEVDDTDSGSSEDEDPDKDLAADDDEQTTEDEDDDTTDDNDSCDSTNFPTLGKTPDEEEDDDEEEDEDVNYLRRGLKSDKYRGNRFCPFPSNNHNLNQLPYGHYRSPVHETNNSNSVFDVIEFNPPSRIEAVSPDFGLQQSPNHCVNSDSFYNNSQLSPQSVPSLNSSPYYTPNYQLNFDQNALGGYQTELSTDDWTKASTLFPNSPSFDLGNKPLEPYSPLSPPLSVPSPLKDGQDSNPCSNLGENENLNDTEDLISIINTINRTSTKEPEPNVIPETEFLKLKNVLEGKEDSIRSEMDIYLKEDDRQDRFQNSFNAIQEPSMLDANRHFSFDYGASLTPPKSVSPVQDPSDCSFSPLSDYGNGQLNSFNSEEHLTNILDGIDEINPDELNIYLEGDSNASDPSYARNIIQSRCKMSNIDHVLRKLSAISSKIICRKDKEGDTCLMIVYSKPEDSQDFYENIFCLQEKAVEIRVCCDHPLGKAKRCKMCGNTDSATFYTPLSLMNKNGDTALSCALKLNHSPVVINYLLYGILKCKEDFRRIFDNKGRAMLSHFTSKYPSLIRYM